MLLREICNACFTNHDKCTLRICLIVTISNDDINVILTCHWGKKKKQACNEWLKKIGYIRYLFDYLISKKEYKHFKGGKKLATHVVLNILYSDILQTVYVDLCVCSKNIKYIVEKNYFKILWIAYH